MSEKDLPSRVARPFVFLAKLLAWNAEAWGKVKEWASAAETRSLRLTKPPPPSAPPPKRYWDWRRGNFTSDPPQIDLPPIGGTQLFRCPDGGFRSLPEYLERTRDV